MQPSPISRSGECRVRDAYARHFAAIRRFERLLRTEHRCGDSSLRADLRSVDDQQTLRVWEFKLIAGHAALGQILTYVSEVRQQKGMAQRVRGVIAALRFEDHLPQTIETLNLGIELVAIPAWLAPMDDMPQGGSLAPSTTDVVAIPYFPQEGVTR